MAKYGMSIMLSGTIDEVKPQVLSALKAQGFGVLTEIDVQKTMKEKLGVEYEPYFILGACNPQLANRALTADRSIGLLLPCNVVIQQVGGEVKVSILDPEIMFSVVEPELKDALSTLPQEARQRLQAALDSLK
ncbi:MAG TPA: DUF302 domain-containing protein [Anaerolineales bacterium]|nr:DUF302 domain-containing protein [Anaerolineales bacterium]